MAVEDWSTTAADNTTLDTIPLGENAMAPSDVNNALRALMADIATWRDGAIADLGASGDYQPKDATLTALAGVITAADKGIYTTASDTFSAYSLTSFGRTLAGLADYAALRTGLGALTVTASSLAKPGYIKLDIAGTTLMFQWGSGVLGGNTTGTINFPQTYSSWAVCIPSGANSDTGQEGNISPTAATGLSSQLIVNSAEGMGTYNWFSVGV